MATGLEPTGSVPEWKPDVDSTHIGDELVMATSAQVQQLYIALLGRAADKPGLDWWLENINGGERTLEQAAAAFTTSEEFVSTYGSLQGAELVTAVYSNLFERTPSQEEVTYWVNDGRPADQLLAAFLAYASPADQTVINNKVFVAEAYSNATGDDYNLDAAAQIVADVNGTIASVNSALATLENGGLPGQVPALGLIKAHLAAEDALASFVEQAGNGEADVNDDGLVDAADLTAAQVNRTAAINDVDATGATATANPALSTTILSAHLADANTALARAEATVTSTSAGAQAVARYDAALTARSSLTVNSTAETAAAQAGFGAAVVAHVAATATLADVAAYYETLDTLVNPDTTATDVITDYTSLVQVLTDVNANPVTRAALVDAVDNLGYGSQVVSLANNELAIARANTELGTAKGLVDAIDGGVYTQAAVDQQYFANVVEAAQSADADITSVQAVLQQIQALTTAANNAETAVNTFDGANAAVSIADLAAGAAATNGSDVFYFKANDVAASDDFSIGGFGTAGSDFIVLGDGYTFNNGAVTTGDNNALEYFIVQGAAGAQIVIETSEFGSSQAVAAANGNVTTPVADNVAVITLTGVNAADLLVQDGVISVA